MNIASTSLLILATLVCSNDAKAQDNLSGLKDFRIVFEEIQHGFESGNVAAFSTHFASQVQVALKGAESGYHSSNQAYYMLENFFKNRKVLSFEFIEVGEAETTPFATGSLVFSSKGTRESAQVYVALMKSAEAWLISEITIY
jgi:hypothetical protein